MKWDMEGMKFVGMEYSQNTSSTNTIFTFKLSYTNGFSATAAKMFVEFPSSVAFLIRFLLSILPVSWKVCTMFKKTENEEWIGKFFNIQTYCFSYNLATFTIDENRIDFFRFRITHFAKHALWSINEFKLISKYG